MIKVTRPTIPTILKTNQQLWTNNLNKLLSKYGSYTKIPTQQRDEVVNNYRKNEIKQAVSNITKGKCVYCESYIENVDYINIEHFYPKSIFPEYTFEWSNLFPACRKCNIHKGNTNIVEKPIVNPEKDNPEEYFTFNNLRIETSVNSPSEQKSINTIEVCDLKRISLTRAYADILIEFYNLENKIKEEIKNLKKLQQKAAKTKRIIKLLDVLDNLKSSAGYSEQYAGFMRYLIKNSSAINKSIIIVNTYKIDIGLTSDYQMNFH